MEQRFTIRVLLWIAIGMITLSAVLLFVAYGDRITSWVVWVTLAITAGITAVLLAILFVFTRRIIGPLNQLSAMIAKTQENQRWPESEPTGAKEIQYLWRQLATLLISLEKQREELKSNVVQKERELQVIDSKCQALLNRINATLEQESKYFSKFLHDEINTMLFSIRLRLENSLEYVSKGCSQETCQKIAKDLEDTIVMLNSAYNDNRYSINQLRPQNIEKLGLVGAITDMLQYYNAMEGCRFSIRVDDTIPPIKGSTGLVAFRVIRECIVNIAKHSQASRALINFNRIRTDEFQRLESLDFVNTDREKYKTYQETVNRTSGDYFHVVIQDNGVGIPKDIYSKKREGIGLLNMQERLEYVSGCLLFSLDSQGTRTDIFFKL